LAAVVPAAAVALGALAPDLVGSTPDRAVVAPAVVVDRPSGFVAVGTLRAVVEAGAGRALTGVVVFASVALGRAARDGRLDVAEGRLVVEEARVDLRSDVEGAFAAAAARAVVPVAPVIRLDKPLAAGFFSSPVLWPAS
jgi:hypothetical protein